MYDITLTGSLIGSAKTIAGAFKLAKMSSENSFPGRLIRVHDVDGETVIGEFRNGQTLIALLP